MPHPITQNQFISKARQVHGDRYDYSKIEFRNTKTKVNVVCEIHGIFDVTPDNHMRGKGCPLCGRQRQADSQRKHASSFIEQARNVHGDRYDYSRVAYHQTRAKVEIVCPEHGAFWQTPDSHLQGNGCRKCSDRLTSERFGWDTTDFIRHAREKFGGKFDYCKVAYVNAWTLITIICPEHGEYQQTPVGHLHGIHGCPKCAQQSNLGNTKALLASNIELPSVFRLPTQRHYAANCCSC